MNAIASPADAETTTCLVQENASLRRYNTFGVDARARWLVRLRVMQALPEVLARPPWDGAPFLVLGEGSNVLFRDDFDGLVVKLDNQRVELLSEDERGVRVRAEAGRNWHSLVNWALERGYAGLENLSLIPGTVGASPVQNIGAYGVELESMVEAVEAWDRRDAAFVELANAQCGFSYRTSVFKSGSALDRYVITAVRFVLPHAAVPVLHYPGVREELVAMGRDTPGARDVSEAICNIRRRKLPDPAQLGNAGSFFKNPVIDTPRAEALARQHPGLPTYPATAGRTKLGAGWMIEQCGFRGRRDGDAGVAETHALVLVNHGHATGAQVWSIAQRIRAAVDAKFGIELEPEPRVL
ncbi:MAG TPA: UDP-N-acetylmuramate dehydrogenase [Candidatus Saccharimonadia bacterium]|nr:UDP-N-acetylmuramate dehydrogenase [Candidatus Saccharimonadia bacterium]